MNPDLLSIPESASPWIEKAVTHGSSLLYALCILVIGIYAAKLISRILEKSMNAKNVDPTVSGFIRNICYAAMIVFVVLAALAKVGIQTASFIAILGAAGLAVGLALQGSLSNFAAGVLLIIFRPFKSGDYISAAGESGTVEEVQIFTTLMRTPDNRAIIIPNANILGGNIINFSAKPTRRIDLVIGVSYDADLARTKEVLQEVVDADARVLKDIDVTIGVSELADSSVNFVVRPWVKTEDYWATYFDLMAAIKIRLDEENIGIPYPQMDLHLVSNSAGQGEQAVKSSAA